MVGFLINQNKIFVHPSETSDISRGGARHLEIPSSFSRPQGVRPSGGGAETANRSVGISTSGAEFPRACSQFCNLAAFLQIFDVTSTTSVTMVLHSVGFSQFKLIPMTEIIRKLCLEWVSPDRFLTEKPFASHPHCAVLTTDAFQFSSFSRV